MDKYHKIQSIYKRDDMGKFTDEYSLQEFEYLKDNTWEFTEKIDGTNIRIGFENGRLAIGGRTDSAQIPTFLYDKLTDIFSGFNNGEIVLYGEGYGKKIQKGEGYIADGVGFILFDVRAGGWWLKREDVEDVAREYGIPKVPVLGYGTLDKACDMCKNGFMSAIGNRDAEGLVLRTTVPLYARNGERIITKVKVRDYK